jgi:hypothetical protein
MLFRYFQIYLQEFLKSKKRPRSRSYEAGKWQKNGASCRSRTDDLLITSQLLYQLS